MNMRGHQPKPLPPGTPPAKPPTGGSAGQKPGDVRSTRNSSHDCPVCRAKQQRIEDLEERLERLEQIVAADDMCSPHEWALTPHEEAIARRLAIGPAKKMGLLAHLEKQFPSPEGRSPNHISVMLHRLRAKLRDYGWEISFISSHCGTYRVPLHQQTAFASAMRGEGSHAFPAKSFQPVNAQLARRVEKGAAKSAPSGEASAQ